MKKAELSFLCGILMCTSPMLFALGDDDAPPQNPPAAYAAPAQVVAPSTPLKRVLGYSDDPEESFFEMCAPHVEPFQVSLDKLKDNPPSGVLVETSEDHVPLATLNFVINDDTTVDGFLTDFYQQCLSHNLIGGHIALDQVSFCLRISGMDFVTPHLTSDLLREVELSGGIKTPISIKNLPNLRLISCVVEAPVRFPVADFARMEAGFPRITQGEVCVNIDRDALMPLVPRWFGAPGLSHAIPVCEEGGRYALGWQGAPALLDSEFVNWRLPISLAECKVCFEMDFSPDKTKEKIPPLPLLPIEMWREVMHFTDPIQALKLMMVQPDAWDMASSFINFKGTCLSGDHGIDEVSGGAIERISHQTLINNAGDLNDSFAFNLRFLDEDGVLLPAQFDAQEHFENALREDGSVAWTGYMDLGSGNGRFKIGPIITRDTDGDGKPYTLYPDTTAFQKLLHFLCMEQMQGSLRDGFVELYSQVSSVLEDDGGAGLAEPAVVVNMSDVSAMQDEG